MVESEATRLVVDWRGNCSRCWLGFKIANALQLLFAARRCGVCRVVPCRAGEVISATI